MKDFAVLRLSELDGNTNIFSTQARTAVQAALRCEQIAQGFCGGIPDPVMAQLAPTLMKNAEKIPGRPNELMFPQHPKVRWLLENVKTLVDTGHRVVIYSRFLAPMFWLQAQKISPTLLHGQLTAEQKAEVIKAFREGPPTVLGCQVTIAEGFNLTECQDVIFWGRDWSPAINRQAEDRCHRIGTKGTVNIQIPIVQGTIETLIDKKLKAKEANAEQALATVTVAELKEAL
jgi:SNF2 family DNA or RNA helicase